MAPAYNEFGSGGFQDFQRPSYDLTNELHIQQEIGQQLSPGGPEQYSSSFSGSPTPPRAQEVAAPPPYAQLPNGYLQSTSVPMPHTTGSPVLPQYSHRSSDGQDTRFSYVFDMVAGSMAMQNGEGGLRVGNNHADTVAME